jgi:hypothetical protein
MNYRESRKDRKKKVYIGKSEEYTFTKCFKIVDGKAY